MQQEELKKRAEEFALKRADLKQEEERVLVESSPEMLTEGRRVKYRTKVAVRSFLVDISVRLDADTGELLGFIIPERYRGAVDTTIDAEEAERLAAEIVEVPKEAELEALIQEKEEDSHISNITWRHVVNGLEVEGDCIDVQINSKTREIIAMTKTWNEVKDYECKISAENAEKIARDKSPEYVTQKEFEIMAAGQKFIPVVDESSGQPKAQFVKVWTMVIFEPADRFPRMTTLDINCVTGKVVRVEHSK